MFLIASLNVSLLSRDSLAAWQRLTNYIIDCNYLRQYVIRPPSHRALSDAFV